MKKTAIIGVLMFGFLLSGCGVVNAPKMEGNVVNQEMDGQVKTNVEVTKSNLNREIVEQEVEYFAGVKGFYAEPKENALGAGVVLIHEWWGLKDEIKESARQLAREGYRVLAVDLHGGKIAQNADEARALVAALDQNVANQNMQSALNFLREKGSEKLASLGWCFGGAQSLNLALTGEKLDATVIYYGNLITEKAELEKIKWPVLGVFGDKDNLIPVENVKAFEQSLNELGVENSINIFADVGHAFANPSGQNYAPEQTKQAWEKTLEFLKKNLQ